MSYRRLVAREVASRAMQIRSFAKLDPGWHYGEGCPAAADAVAAALTIDSLLLESNAHEIEVFPGVDGGILICGYHGDHSLEIRCEPSGRMRFLHEVDDEVLSEQPTVSLADLSAYLEALEWTPKNSFAYSTPSTSAGVGAVSPVRLFSHPPAEASRYSIRSVLLSIAMGNAVISIGTIGPLLETPRSFGESIPVYSQGPAGSRVNIRRPETSATATSTVWHRVLAET
jgi:hypothetical protein